MAQGWDVHVALDGSDSQPGTRDRPFLTLERAREEIRALKFRKSWPPPGGATVWIHGGVYERKAPFELWTVDSGAPDARIVWRSVPGEDVVLRGGREIEGFQPVSEPDILNRLPAVARGHVLQKDLRSDGISDFGVLRRRGFGVRTVPAEMELFYQGRRMPAPRWPNEGFAKVTSVPRGLKGGVFGYEGDRPAAWSRIEDISVHGYWHNWADTVERVRSIDPLQRLVETEPPHGPYGYSVGNLFYFFNIFEELNDPGEWYLDRQTGILYFWPPDDNPSPRVTLSLLESPLILLHGACHVTWQGLTVECGRDLGIEIRGGRDNHIFGCTVRNMGTHGVVISEAPPDLGRSRHTVRACHIHDVGEMGVILGGGERKTLTPGENLVENCHIHHYARRARSSRPGIQINGVGNRLAHNHIHDAPHYAIMLSGNEHVIEFNEIHDVALESDDGGAFYVGRNASCRGNLIRYNFWHHIGHPFEPGQGTHGVNVVYFDDGAGGATVFGNVFYRTGRLVRPDYGTVFVNGGIGVIVENNLFIECEEAIGFVDWGPGVLNDITRTGGKEWAQWILPWLYRDVNILEEPYRSRYPELYRLATERRYRGANIARRNVAWRCGRFLVETTVEMGPDGEPVLRDGRWHIITRDGDLSRPEYSDNLILNEDPGFVDAASMDFRLKPDAMVFRRIRGFEAIPFERIGLGKDTPQ